MASRPSDLNETIELVWAFLAPAVDPQPADAIFVFGGVDLLVPARASELWNAGYAKTISVSGGAGALTHKHFSELEAVVFRDVMIERGVNPADIVLETRASNSGQNVEFGMAALRDAGFVPQKLLLVAKPFIMRRCIATFGSQYPETTVFPCPPLGGPRGFIDRSESEFVQRLVAEVDRLDSYSDLGYIVPVDVPSDVRGAVELLRISASD
jgi:uncharacterized SAM-binding protein YcdF (DUF218 family)